MSQRGELDEADEADDEESVLVTGEVIQRLAALATLVALVVFGGLLYSCEAQRNRLSECTKNHPVAECREAFRP